ncbi:MULTISPECIES: nuclear transport factor 2 family protein [Micromonospora]|uniref:nuclear transport factor 2 family protein n=1 Tax=Micromonospora TaxID=1873 RepID=UPI0018EE433D|nr:MULTISPECIES: nuclear transport factor 2 family protein [Micromonospora]
MLLTAGIAGGLTVLAGAGVASAGGPRNPDVPGRPAMERRNMEAVRRAFARQNAGGDIYDILHDEVEWTIVNGRTYTSKAEFLAQGSAPIMDRLASTLVMTIRDMWADGDTVIIRFAGDATATDGVDYHNEYCWIWQLRGGDVVRSHAFLDMVAVRELIDRIDLT